MQLLTGHKDEVNTHLKFVLSRWLYCQVDKKRKTDEKLINTLNKGEKKLEVRNVTNIVYICYFSVSVIKHYDQKHL